MAGELFEESGAGMDDAAAAAALKGLFGGDRGAASPPAATPIEDEGDALPAGAGGAADEVDPPAQGDSSADNGASGGDDAGTPKPAAGDPPADEEQDYEFRGKTYKLPKALVEGRMRLDDYRAKTEDLAMQRKVFAQQELVAKLNLDIQRAVAPDLGAIQNIDQRIASIRGQMPDPAADPMAYLTLDKQAKDLEAARTQMQAAVLAKGTELLKQKQAAQADLLRTGTEQLVRDIPNWTDPKVQADVVRHAMDMGFTVEELNNAFDPRFIRVIHDAMQFRRGKAAASPAAITQKRVTQAAPTVRPSGTVNQAGTQRGQLASLKDKATRSGSPDDAIAALTAAYRSAGRRR